MPLDLTPQNVEVFLFRNSQGTGYVEGDPINYNDKSGLRRGELVGEAIEEFIQIIGYYFNGEELVGYPVFSTSRQIGRQRQGPVLSFTEQAEENLWRGMVRAIQALTLNEECMELYGNEQTRAGRFNPVDVIESLVTGYLSGSESEYGKIEVVPGTQGAEVTRFLGLFGTIHVKIGLYLLQGEGSRNTADIAHTLLHELGHLYDLTRGSGGSGLGTPDAVFSDKGSRENDWIVDQKCFNGALGYKKP